MSAIANGTQYLTDAAGMPSGNHSACAWCISNVASGVQVPYAIQGASFFAGTPFVDYGSSPNWQFFSQDVGVINLGTPAANWTFIGYTRVDNTVNGTSIYTGTGGALAQTGPTGSAVAITPASIAVGNQNTPTVPLSGVVVGFRVWNTVLTADEMAVEYLRLRPIIQPQNLNRWYPMWNVASVADDWSGQGTTPTVTGTYANSRSMPPVPYA